MNKNLPMLVREYKRKKQDLESNIQARKKLLETLNASIRSKEKTLKELEGKVQELNADIEILKETHNSKLKDIIQEVNAPVIPPEVTIPTDVPITEPSESPPHTEVPPTNVTEQPKEQTTEAQIIVWEDTRPRRMRERREAEFND